MKKHFYHILLNWTGNLGKGTSSYRGYSRNHEISVESKPAILASSDPSFRGDPSRYNPEELFVASLSQCHMLWFLHLCSEQKIVVVKYADHASGTMEESPDGGGRFTEVILRPNITVETGEHLECIDALHKKANELCFIANSCNFKVKHEGSVTVKK